MSSSRHKFKSCYLAQNVLSFPTMLEAPTDETFTYMIYKGNKTDSMIIKITIISTSYYIVFLFSFCNKSTCTDTVTDISWIFFDSSEEREPCYISTEPFSLRTVTPFWCEEVIYKGGYSFNKEKLNTFWVKFLPRSWALLLKHSPMFHPTHTPAVWGSFDCDSTPRRSLSLRQPVAAAPFWCSVMLFIRLHDVTAHRRKLVIRHFLTLWAAITITKADSDRANTERKTVQLNVMPQTGR